MEAAMEGHRLCVQELLAGGAKTDVKNSLNGRTALGEASTLGNVETVQELLAAGAGVDLEDLDGRSPLALAAGQGHCQVVSPIQILEYQTDMRRCRFDTLGKSTPAHRAGAPTACEQWVSPIVPSPLKQVHPPCRSTSNCSRTVGESDSPLAIPMHCSRSTHRRE